MALREMIEELTDAEIDEMVGTSSYPSAFAALVVRREPDFEPDFSGVERNVILLARRDPLASLEPPGMIERAFAWVFGTQAGTRQLADPRLEALRRAAVVTRHRHHLPDTIAAELRTLGYGEQRIRALERLALGI